MYNILVERVLLREAHLQRDKLGAWVLLEGDEEETSHQFAGLRVHPVGERVAPPQNLDGSVSNCQPNMCVEGNHWRAIWPLRVEVNGVELAGLAQWRAAHLVAANNLLLIAKDVAVPGFDPHANAACHDICAALHPGWLMHPDIFVE